MVTMMMMMRPGVKCSQTPLSSRVAWRKSCVVLSFSSEWNWISITWSSDVTPFVPCKMAPQWRWRPSAQITAFDLFTVVGGYSRSPRSLECQLQHRMQPARCRLRFSFEFVYTWTFKANKNANAMIFFLNLSLSFHLWCEFCNFTTGMLDKD